MRVGTESGTPGAIGEEGHESYSSAVGGFSSGSSVQCRILVVDDEAPTREMLADLLDALGYQCECVEGPVAALSAMRANPGGFQLVLSDHNMPAMCGTELALEIHKHEPDLPIVLLTAFRDSAVEAARERFFRILDKPIGMRDLHATLTAALAQG